MPTYPLTFPSVGIKSSVFGITNAVSSSVSPFTFRQQVYDHGGARWEGEVTFVPCRGANAAEIEAFLVELRGQYGTFLYGDPDYLASGPRGTATSASVVGGGQTGNSLIVDGMGSLKTLLKSDYFQLGTGTGARLYKMVQDATSDSAGNATLTFEPALRSSPADNATVTIVGAKGAMRLATNKQQWPSNRSQIKDITIQFVEAIGE